MTWQLFFYLWILICTIIFLLQIYCRQLHQYWKKLRVPHTNPRFPFGDFQKGGFSKNLGLVYKDLYDEFPKERFFGFWLFFRPILMIRNPELIKTVFVKDFMSFHDRGVYFNEKDDPLSAHLFSIRGSKWKNIKNKLTPTFTSGKMKMMFPIVVKCSEELKDYMLEVTEKEDVVEIKEIVARFMTDVIALCAFGIETKCLRNPNVMFRQMGKKSLQPTLRNLTIFLMQFMMPEWAEIIRLKVTHKDVSEFFLGAVKDIMTQREKNNIKRNDFMQLLINLKNKGTVEITEGKTLEGEKLTFEEAAAQAFVFYLAGFETSSATVQFALYELALNQDVQEKLRNEIQTSIAESNNQLTYEGVHGMSYLGKVIDETLRKYPVLPLLVRKCNRNFQIPDTNIVIQKGTLVQIPVFGIQMDPEYYPDPEKFDPERFSDEEKQKRHNYTYLPFGEGPRSCIGKRFGLMQTRITLISLLLNFKFEIAKQSEGPMVFETKSLVLLPKGGMHLKVKPL